jgi:aminocarboxymuconate-semialdehyde decarboxylase
MDVVDTHFHWYPKEHLERMRRRAEFPRVEREGERYVYLYNGGRDWLNLPPVWTDLDKGLRVAADATGPGTAVLCTTGVLSGLLDQVPAAEAAEVALEYNEQIAAAQRRFPGRFYGTAYVPLLDTEETLRVVDHAVKELGLKAVNLPAATGEEPIDVARLEPFYDRVEELGLPLIVHPTDIVYGQVFGGYAGSLQLTIGRLLDSSMTVLRLIFSGIMERHSDLKVIHTHAGGLLPYQAGRIDKNTRVTGLPERPSTYLKRTYVDTVAPQALTVRTALEFYGTDHVLYGTDYPCWSPRAAIGVIEEADLSPDQRSAILARNAERVLDLT